MSFDMEKDKGVFNSKYTQKQAYKRDLVRYDLSIEEG